MSAFFIVKFAVNFAKTFLNEIFNFLNKDFA